MIQIIQTIIILIATAIASYTDAKTGYIYDWITYPLIIIGGITALWTLYLGNWFNIASGIGIFALLFLVYKTGKLGGGDVKLFTGIALANPFSNINFLLTLIFTSAVISMLFYSVYYTLKIIRNGINIKKNKKDLLKAGFFELFFIGYLIITWSHGIINELFILIVGVPLGAGIIFMGLQKEIKKRFYETKISINEIEEDELLGDKNNKKVKNLLKGQNLINPKEATLLKKNKINSIYVLRNLPKFGPFIFLGAIIALFYPELIITLF